LKRIASRLEVSVGSVHLWTRDIQLSAEQQRENLIGPRGPQNPQHIANRVAAWRAKNRARRRHYQKEGQARAREGDPLHTAGCMLYWAEGSKSRNTATFANSDPHMVRFFAHFLRESMRVPSSDFRIRLNVYTNNGLSLTEIEGHWLKAVGAPRSCLRGHSLNHYPTSTSGKRPRRLPYGVCTLTVARSTWLVQHIAGAIQEYGGFNELRWLDGSPRKSQAGRRRAVPVD
jgi:hypothetical protein